MHTTDSNFSNFVIKYRGEIKTEFENTSACLSGVQMGSNQEKNGGRKSRNTHSLKNYTIKKCQLKGRRKSQCGIKTLHPCSRDSQYPESFLWSNFLIGPPPHTFGLASQIHAQGLWDLRRRMCTEKAKVVAAVWRGQNLFNSLPGSNEEGMNCTSWIWRKGWIHSTVQIVLVQTS